MGGLSSRATGQTPTQGDAAEFGTADRIWRSCTERPAGHGQMFRVYAPTAIRTREVLSRLQELEGSEEQRISLLAAESDLHPRLIRIALDYAAEHADEVRERIDRNREMAARSRRMARQRESLLACRPS